MSVAIPSDVLYIGWDVGGWNCERNTSSRDALVVLDGQRRLLGEPWRGNLRNVINQASSTESWIQSLLKCCKVAWRGDTAPKVVLAIDTPLGFSLAFQQLITGQDTVDVMGDSATNPYLYRLTERLLFEHGLAPLSAVKDMIGSQANKGIHVLARFAPERCGLGVWSDNHNMWAIEAYPSACKRSAMIKELLAPFITSQPSALAQDQPFWHGAAFSHGIDHTDKRDALICALLAWLFVNQPQQLLQPSNDVPPSEGWIFIPSDARVKA